MIILVTLVVLLLFTNFLAYENDKMTQKKYAEKLVLEFVAMLCIIFIFSKFNALNLTLALSTIVIVSYGLENTLYKTFQKMVRKENFQIRSSDTKDKNSISYYNLNHLYPDKTRIKKEPNFKVVEPEDDTGIQFANELIFEDIDDVYIIEKTVPKPTTTTQAPTTTTTQTPTTPPTTSKPTEPTTTIIEQVPSSSWGNFVINMRNFFF